MSTKWYKFSSSLCQLLFETQSPNLVSSLFTGKRFSPQCDTTLDWYIIGYCIARSSKTATWQMYYDHTMGHKPEHIEMLIKGLSSFQCSSEQCGYIDDLVVQGGSDLPKCLQFLPALVPYASNLTSLYLRGKLPSEECEKLANALRKDYYKLADFQLVTCNTAADCLKVISTLSQLPQLEVLQLGFSDAGTVQIPPQKMNKLRDIAIWVSYTLSLHESLIVPNYSSLQEIYLFNCNMMQDCTQALAAFLQSPNNNIKEFTAVCCSFGDNLYTIATALASTKNMKHLIIAECNIGMEGAQLIAQAMEKNDTINEVQVVDETITVQGALHLLNSLSSKKDLKLVLCDSFEDYLSFIGQEEVNTSFTNYADNIDHIKKVIQEIL